VKVGKETQCINTDAEIVYINVLEIIQTYRKLNDAIALVLHESVVCFGHGQETMYH